MQPPFPPQGARRDTYLLDPENAAEMARLEIQGSLLTRGMGGILPELENRLPEGCARVVDLACGPGEWVREVAQAYPQVEVIGIDISQLMITYARAKAEDMQLGNAHFRVGSVLESLDFLDDSLDLVNARFLGLVQQRERWGAFVRECVRVVRPGGLVRLTECDDSGRTSSAAGELLRTWLLEASRRGGYGLAPTADSLGTTTHLAGLLSEAGCQEIIQRPWTIDCSWGTELYTSQRQNHMVGFKQAERLFVRLGLTTTEEFQVIYDQMLVESASETFRSTLSLLTATGKKRTD